MEQTGESLTFCAECGYDLRAIDSPRCPECGWSIDRLGSPRSRIPWTFRGAELSRWTAYWRTVSIATLRWRRLAEEIAKPVAMSDAILFASLTALFAGASVGLSVLLFMIQRGANVLTPIPDSPIQAFGTMLSPTWDLRLPLAAGLTRWSVPPLGAVLAFWLIARCPAWWFRWKAAHISPTQHQRAVALSYYVVAPLALLPFGAWVIALPMLKSDWFSNEDYSCILMAGGWGILCLIATCSGALRLLGRTLHASPARLVITAVGLPISWALCVATGAIVLPWIFGLLRLIFDSLRS